MGMARSCLKRCIHAPGLGSNRRAAGQMLMSKNGAARPKPRAANTLRDCAAGKARVAPIAVAMNGAVHGVATSTASTPVKNDPRSLVSSTAVAFSPNSTGSSNRPSRLAPTATITSARKPTKYGFCSWNPQPIAAPVAFSASMIPAMTRKLSTTPAV